MYGSKSVSGRIWPRATASPRPTPSSSSAGLGMSQRCHQRTAIAITISAPREAQTRPCEPRTAIAAQAEPGTCLAGARASASDGRRLGRRKGLSARLSEATRRPEHDALPQRREPARLGQRQRDDLAGAARGMVAVVGDVDAWSAPAQWRWGSLTRWPARSRAPSGVLRSTRPVFSHCLSGAVNSSHVERPVRRPPPRRLTWSGRSRPGVASPPSVRRVIRPSPRRMGTGQARPRRGRHPGRV